MPLHGQHDQQVPASIATELAEDAPTTEVELFDAAHVRSYNAEPERWTAAVTDFLDRAS